MLKTLGTYSQCDRFLLSKSSHRTVNPLWRTVQILLLTGTLYGCGDPEVKKPQSIPVRVMEAQYDTTAENTLTLPGVIVSRVESPMAFRVFGLIQTRSVNVGNQVVAGTLLAQLDEEPFQLAIEQAEAQLRQAQSSLAQIERDVSRKIHLKNKGLLAAAEFDLLLTTRTNAQSQVSIAQSQRKQAYNELAYTRLVAPEDSIVTAVHAEAGQVVSAGTPIMTLAYSGQPEVQVDIPESHIAMVNVGDQTLITLLSQQHLTLSGKVREIAPQADPGTRTFQAHIVLDSTPEQLRLGMTATVSLPGPVKPPVIRLPISTLLQRNQQTALWILPKGQDKLLLRPITVAELGSDSFTVASGVEPGERVVTAGVHRLDENLKVHEWQGLLP